MTRMMPRGDDSLVSKPDSIHDAPGEQVERGLTSPNDSLAYRPNTTTAVIDAPVQQEPEVTATPEPQEPEEPKPDPYNKVDYKKRYDDLKRHYDRTVSSHKKEVKELKEGSTPVYKAPKTLEELEEFKKENPDVFAIVETIAHLQSEKQTTELKKVVQELQDKLAVSEASVAYAELKAAVPDLEEIRASEDFHNWAEQQPQQIQDWIYKNKHDIALAIKAIELYKAQRRPTQQATPPVPQQPDPRSQAAQAVQTSSRSDDPSGEEKIWSAKAIQAMRPADFEKHEAEIMKAYAEGRIRP